FQAVQFMPAFIFPQLLLCGLFVARDQMAPLLEAVSWVMPFTWAYDALARAVSPQPLSGRVAVDAAVVLAVTIGSLIFGAMTLRRRTA
ncbi:MAG TPA: ABC transporter permease, partial [Solirubrobacterales bacterium]|nr:ABC transporter permease [Solirubrobacterales bacterium]